MPTMKPQKPQHVLQKKSNAALKKAEKLGLELEKYKNKSGYKFVVRRMFGGPNTEYSKDKFPMFYAEIMPNHPPSAYVSKKYGILQPVKKTGMFDTAEEAALALAMHLAGEYLRKRGMNQKNAIDVDRL